MLRPMGRMSRREVALWLVAFLALTGTGVAASPLLTGKDVRDGSLRSADVRDGSLTRADFSRAPRGPRGPEGPRGPWGPAGPPGPIEGPRRIPTVAGAVAADGTVSGGAFTVEHPAGGVYCLHVAGARSAQVSSAALTPRALAAQLYAPGAAPEPPCGAGTTIRVDVAGGADSPFNLIARTG